MGKELVIRNTLNIDLKELSNRFISYLDIRQKSLETYEVALRQFFNWIQVNNIKNPTREDIIAFREELKLKVKSNTVQSYLIALKQFFKWTSMEQIYPNISDNVKGVKIDNVHKRDALTLEQIQKVLGSITNIRDYALISLLATCGLRTIEVERANIEDIKVIGNNTVLFIQGKGKDEKAEFVKLPNIVLNSINKYINTRKDNNNALFVSNSNRTNGERLVTRSIRGIIKRYFRQNDLDSERLSSHSLRHTAGTLALLGGASLQEVQQMLRHSKMDTTMIYVHNLERINNKSEENVANMIFGGTNNE